MTQPAESYPDPVPLSTDQDVADEAVDAFAPEDVHDEQILFYFSNDVGGFGGLYWLDDRSARVRDQDQTTEDEADSG